MSGKSPEILKVSETQIVSNYPRDAGVSLGEKLQLVLRAMRLAGDQIAAGLFLLFGFSRVSRYFSGYWDFVLFLAIGIAVCTWQAWRASSILEHGLGWRRLNTVSLTIISGLLMALGGVLLYIVAARILHKNGIKFMFYWNDAAIQEKIAALEQENALQA